MNLHLVGDESTAFEVVVGGVDLDEVQVDGLDQIEEEARALGVELLVGWFDPARYEVIVPFQQRGLRIVEASFVLRRRPAPPPRPSTEVVVERGGVDDLGAIDHLLGPIVHWSAASHDPRLGSAAATRLLQLRIEERVENGSELHLGWVDGSAVGFALLVPGGSPTLELIAAAEPSSGQADALIASALEAFGAVDVESGPIAVGNVPAVRFLERHGFTASRTRYRYHRWLDEEASP